ncbi:MAG: hypothetical protein NC093_02925 [Alistipes sp.]|nr:hypothetical protein [Alistipes sp.]
MNETTTTINASSRAEGTAELMIFFVFLMFVFWCINTYRHIKGGKWSLFQKITDIGGMIFFGIIIIVMIIPLI